MMPLWVVLLSSGLAASDSRSYGFPSGKACGTAVNLGLPTSPGANLSAPLDVLRTLASQPSTLLCNNGHGLLIAPYPFDYCDHGSVGNNSQLQSSNAGSNSHAGIFTAAQQQHAARSSQLAARLHVCIGSLGEDDGDPFGEDEGDPRHIEALSVDPVTGNGRFDRVVFLRGRRDPASSNFDVVTPIWPPRAGLELGPRADGHLTPALLDTQEPWWDTPLLRLFVQVLSDVLPELVLYLASYRKMRCVAVGRHSQGHPLFHDDC
jgi:hypothetical protein